VKHGSCWGEGSHPHPPAGGGFSPSPSCWGEGSHPHPHPPAGGGFSPSPSPSCWGRVLTLTLLLGGGFSPSPSCWGRVLTLTLLSGDRQRHSDPGAALSMGSCASFPKTKPTSCCPASCPQKSRSPRSGMAEGRGGLKGLCTDTMGVDSKSFSPMSKVKDDTKWLFVEHYTHEFKAQLRQSVYIHCDL